MLSNLGCVISVCDGTFLVIPVTCSVVAIAMSIVTLTRPASRSLGIAAIVMSVASTIMVLVFG